MKKLIAQLIFGIFILFITLVTLVVSIYLFIQTRELVMFVAIGCIAFALYSYTKELFSVVKDIKLYKVTTPTDEPTNEEEAEFNLTHSECDEYR